MLRNYIVIAVRNLLKSRLYSFINIAGLSIGTAIVLLIFLYVRDEWTFDKFHANADRTYRAWVKEHYKGEVFFNTVTPVILGEELRDNFPGIQRVARYLTISTQAKKGNFSEEENIHAADPTFLEIFDFELLKGKKEQVLEGVHQAVITEAMGKKYFGDPAPVGQTLSLSIWGEWTDFTVSGIIEQAPANSSIQYDVIISFASIAPTLSEGSRTSWTNVAVETYLLLNEQNAAGELEAQIAPFVDEKVAKIYEPGEYKVGLQPLTDIHLNNDFPLGIVPVSDSRYPYILSGIALLILLLAAINFTTLAVGRSVTRAKEVGMRKVSGATRAQLMFQFWSEAILTAAVAVLFGVLMVEAVMPFFNNLADKQLGLSFSGEMLGILAGLALLTGLISGVYPALVLSGFAPLQTLRGAVSKTGSDRHLVLRGLVGFQFVLSILLISCTLVMTRQMRFIQNKNLGYDQEQVVVLPYNRSGIGLGDMMEEGMEVAQRLRNELSGKAGIIDIAVSGHTFGTPGWTNVGYSEPGTEKYHMLRLVGVDDRFLPMMAIRLLDGRNFSSDQPGDLRSVVINERYARQFGLEDPVGKYLPEPYQEFKVIGLTGDFNFESLHNEVEPLIMARDAVGIVRRSSDVMFGDFPVPKISVKITGDDLQASLSALRLAWKKAAPDQAFTYSFMDDNIDRQYRAETRLSRLLGIATGLAIFIACMGLFGIATLTTAQRRKEIGVRKVLGATTADIVLLLNKRFTILVALASVLAIPLAWYFMSGWLEDFAYHVAVSPLSFLIAAVAALLLAWLAVGWQSIHAAIANPVNSLRDD